MSLIQEALEKASRGKTPEKPAQTVSPESFLPPVWENPAKTKAAAPIPQKTCARFEISSLFLVRAGLFLTAILLMVGAYFLFAKWGKSPLMIAGVPSVVSESKVISSPAVPEFKLTGITNSGTEKLALINNQVVGLGDRLREKAFVVQIGENFAILDYDGKKIQLTL